MDALTRQAASGHGAGAAALLTIVLVTLLVGARIDNRVVGLFHDDGIYVVVGQALADGRGHRIVSLPGEPHQTKYPPLYAAGLALASQAAPAFPESIRWFKRMNLLFVALALAGVWYSTRDHLAPATRVLALAVIGTCPGVVSLSDYVMTDVAFLAGTVWYCRLWRRASEDDTTSAHLAVAAVSAAAVLTRSVGIAMVITSVAACLWRRQWGRALLHATLPGLAFAGWMLWAGQHRVPDAGALLAYYVEYERSAVGYILQNPDLARDIVVGNIVLAASGMALPLGPAWGALGMAYVLLLMTGVGRSLTSGPRLPLLFGAVYLGLVLLHPFAPHRYLLPLVPLVVFLILNGTERVAHVVSRRFQCRARPGVAAAIAASTVLVPNLWLFESGRRDAADAVRSWYGRDLGYRWSGFEETFSWVRSHTRPDDVLGTMFDGSYFLHTGRRAVRPWIHHPETYFYPVGHARPFVGEPRAVLAALHALGVTHVILDPVTGSVAGEAATAMLRALLSLPEAGAELVFTSADGLHRVYRLRS